MSDMEATIDEATEPPPDETPEPDEGAPETTSDAPSE